MFFSPRNLEFADLPAEGARCTVLFFKKIHFFLFQSLNSSGNLFQFFANLAAAVNKMGSFFPHPG